MDQKRRMLLLPLFLALFLFSACAGGGDLSPASPSPSEGTGGEDATVTLRAAFYREDGEPLAGETVRLSAGESIWDHVLDESGSLTAPHIPGAGTLTVCLLDGQGGERSSIRLSLSRGTVIDAAVDQEGEGHITWKEGSAEVAVIFTLAEDGALECALSLSPLTAV